MLRNGLQTGFLAHENELFRSLLTGVTNGMSYEGTQADGYTNCLMLSFGEKT